MSEIDEMKYDMVSNLASLLIGDNPGMSLECALDEVLNSDTYQKLLNDKTGLYYQSARYVYSFLTNECQTGKSE